MNLESITHLLALAGRLEAEGQLNNAKLLYAAVDSILTRSAYKQEIPTDKAALVAETDRAIAELAELDFEPDFLRTLHQSRHALSEGRLSHFEETPDPYVCRTCGNLTLDDQEVCPVCSAHPVTFKHIPPAFWLDAFDPFQCLAHLRTTPEDVAALIEAASDAQANLTPRPGEWSLRQAVMHLRDAQGVLEYRVDLILDQENPLLESKAVFEWADQAAGRPETVGEIFETYRRSRQKTTARLEGIPLESWWRSGRHEEFGELRLFQQVSYFTCHELVHMPQLKSLAVE